MSCLKTVLVCILAFALVFPPVSLNDSFRIQPANAGWFDKYTGSIVTHGTGSWTLQQQHHYAAGGFSMRFPTNTTRLLSFTSPKISVGCGGIDAFWGAFSFLDPEYLVQMLRNILQAAPAFAFKLALEAMCEPCSAILAELMAIAEAMNALAVDECGISNAIAHAGAKKVSEVLNFKAQKGETSGSGTDWLTKGLKEIQGSLKDVKDFVYKVKDMLKFKFCSDVDEAFMKTCERLYTEEGTLWAKVQEWEVHTAQENDRFNDDEIALFRSLLGDITFTPGNDTNDKADGSKTEGSTQAPQAKVQYGEACQGTTVGHYFKTMVATDETESKNEVDFWSGAGCVQKSLPDALRFGWKASQGIAEIVNNMQSNRKTALSDTAIDLISRNSIPVYKILNLFAIRNRIQGGAFMTAEEIAMITKISAIGHAAFILESGIRKAYQVFTTVSHELLPVFGAVQGHVDEFIKAKSDFDQQVIMVQNELHQRENTEMLAYKDNLDGLMKVISVQRSLEESLYAPMYSLR